MEHEQKLQPPGTATIVLMHGEYAAVSRRLNERLEKRMPSSLPAAGYDMETLGRLASRGLFVEAFFSIPDENGAEKDHLYVYLEPGSPACAMYEAYRAESEPDSRLMQVFFKEAKTETDDDRFKSRWIHLY